MSFRTAYSDSKRSSSRSSRGLNRGLIPDKTPEEHKKMLDEHYRLMRNWTPSKGRK
jgi:hypothetical protein